MSYWDYGVFNEKLGNTVQYGVVVANWFTGKSTIFKAMAEQFGH